MKLATMACALAALTIGAAAAAQASAQPLEGGVTARDVARVLRGMGYKAVVGVDRVGDPKVESAADGTDFTVFFYGCNHTPRCASLTFQSGFHVEGGLTFERINSWNHDHRFLKGWLDDVNDPFCEMDIDAEHGFTSQSLQSYVRTWTEILPSYKSFIGFNS